MDEEIDRMIESKRRAIFFLVLFIVAIAVMITILIVMGSGDYGGGNDEFSQLEARGEVKTKRYDVADFKALCFFYDGVRGERTLFLDALPNLKIVNSDKFYVEVKANKELLDILEVVNIENVLSLGFQTSYYKVVSSSTDNYDKGLYVTCDVFEVTVYAPVSQLYTSAEITLDYQAPVTDLMRIHVIGEVQNGKVYGIDAEKLECKVSGSSSIELIGKVSGNAALTAYHDSAIEAEQLYVSTASTVTSSQIFGFSEIYGNGYSETSFISVGSMFSCILVVLPIAMAALCALFFVKYFKRKKQIDGVIAMLEQQEGFFENSMRAPFIIKDEKKEEKNEEPTDEKNSENSENLLQNDE